MLNEEIAMRMGKSAHVSSIASVHAKGSANPLLWWRDAGGAMNGRPISSDKFRKEARAIDSIGAVLQSHEPGSKAAISFEQSRRAMEERAHAAAASDQRKVALPRSGFLLQPVQATYLKNIGFHDDNPGRQMRRNEALEQSSRVRTGEAPPRQEVSAGPNAFGMRLLNAGAQRAPGQRYEEVSRSSLLSQNGLTPPRYREPLPSHPGGAGSKPRDQAAVALFEARQAHAATAQPQMRTLDPNLRSKRDGIQRRKSIASTANATENEATPMHTKTLLSRRIFGTKKSEHSHKKLIRALTKDKDSMRRQKLREETLARMQARRRSVGAG